VPTKGEVIHWVPTSSAAAGAALAAGAAPGAAAAATIVVAGATLTTAPPRPERDALTGFLEFHLVHLELGHRAHQVAELLKIDVHRSLASTKTQAASAFTVRSRAMPRVTSAGSLGVAL